MNSMNGLPFPPKQLNATVAQDRDWPKTTQRPKDKDES